MGLQGQSAVPASFASLQTQFLTERRYLKNLTPRSIGWYESVFRLYTSLAHNADTL
jgi:hypothetical protein